MRQTIKYACVHVVVHESKCKRLGIPLPKRGAGGWVRLESTRSATRVSGVIYPKGI